MCWILLQAKLLASKIFCFYSNLSEFASNQRHYDWSLRSVKIVLLAAGALMRRDPELEEEAIVMATLRDMNVSKIVAEDLDIFRTLLTSLFPGTDPPEAYDSDLDGSVNDAIVQRDLWPDSGFIRQVSGSWSIHTYGIHMARDEMWCAVLRRLDP